MLDLDQLQSIAQSVDSMEAAVVRLEEAYGRKEGESFDHAKKGILDMQKSIAGVVR